MKKVITASIVLYNTNPIDLQKAINSFFITKQNTKLYLIDNSLVDVLRDFKYFNSTIIADFIIKKSFGSKNKTFFWENLKTNK